MSWEIHVKQGKIGEFMRQESVGDIRIQTPLELGIFMQWAELHHESSNGGRPNPMTPYGIRGRILQLPRFEVIPQLRRFQPVIQGFWDSCKGR
jgi:hypothetical protein